MNQNTQTFQSQEEYDKQVRRQEIEKYEKEIQKWLNHLMEEYADRITFEIDGIPLSDRYQPLIATFYFKGQYVTDIVIDEDRENVVWHLVLEFMTYFAYFLITKVEEADL
jgi:hypothetical protein